MPRKTKTRGKPARKQSVKKQARGKAKARAVPKARPVNAKARRIKQKPRSRPTAPVKAKAPSRVKRPSRKAAPSSATASVILAGPAANPTATEPKDVPRKWQKHYRSLIQLRDALMEQSGRLVREAHEEAVGHSMHMADSGTDSFDRDFALSLLSADQNALAEIDFAIQRIVTGNYGICEMTGKPIGEARLEAIPWTRFSYEAQQELERSGGANRVQLGSLRTVHGGDLAEPTEGDEEEEEKKESE